MGTPNPTAKCSPMQGVSLADLSITLVDPADGHEVAVSGEALAVVLALTYDRTCKGVETDGLTLQSLTNPGGIASALEGLSQIMDALGDSHEASPIDEPAYWLVSETLRDLAARANAIERARNVTRTTRVEILAAPPAAAGGGQ